MYTEEQTIVLSKKIADYHNEDEKRSQGDRYQNLAYIMYGFTLATASLAFSAISLPTTKWTIAAAIVSVVAAVFFLAIGVKATKKLRKYRGLFEF